MLRRAKIKGIKGALEVNEDGTAILLNGLPRKPYKVKCKCHTQGFLQVCIDGKKLYVHRIVAEAWVPNEHPVIHKLVLHKDNNSMNNYFKNLMWGNSMILHQNRLVNNISGFGNYTFPNDFRGSSKISHKEAKKIAQRLNSGEKAYEIAEEYDVSEMSIARIRKRYCKKIASPRYDKTVKRATIALLKKYTPKEVSDITGLRYETIWRWDSNNRVNPNWLD